MHESFVATIPLVFCEAEKMDPETQFLKVMMIDEPEILDKAISRIPAEVKEKYTVLKSAPYFLEILDKRVNKGTGVKSLADALGIKAEEVMAIGDQENDIAMIEYAGVGVAMDNAIPSVKEIANFVTKSNLEDGVAYAIEICAELRNYGQVPCYICPVSAMICGAEWSPGEYAPRRCA